MNPKDKRSASQVSIYELIDRVDMSDWEKDLAKARMQRAEHALDLLSDLAAAVARAYRAVVESRRKLPPSVRLG